MLPDWIDSALNTLSDLVVSLAKGRRQVAIKAKAKA
jgi:hypothetical protein